MLSSRIASHLAVRIRSGFLRLFWSRPGNFWLRVRITIGWLYRILHLRGWMSKCRLIQKSRPRIDVLFVVSGAHLNSPSTSGLMADKTQKLQQAVRENGYRCIQVLSPFSAAPLGRTHFSTFWLEPFLFTRKLRRIFLPSKGKQLAPAKVILFQQFNSQQILGYHIWDSVLQRLRPKAIIGVGLTKDLIVTAKEANCITIEVQHGAYTNAERILDETALPDHFLLWDEHWKSQVLKEGVSASIVGFPLITTLPVSSPPTLQDKRVITTLSWGIDNAIDDLGMVHRDLDAAIMNLLEAGYHITLRIHPVAVIGLSAVDSRVSRFRKIQKTLSNRYPTAKLSFPTKQTLAEAILDNSCLVTYASSTILEAAYLGVPSVYLINSRHIGGPTSLFNSGYAIGSATEEVVASVLQQSSHNWIPLPRNENMEPLLTYLFSAFEANA